MIDSEIPALLSKKEMKKTNTVLDFEIDVVWIFGEKRKEENFNVLITMFL